MGGLYLNLRRKFGHPLRGGDCAYGCVFLCQPLGSLQRGLLMMIESGDTDYGCLTACRAARSAPPSSIELRTNLEAMRDYLLNLQSAHFLPQVNPCVASMLKARVNVDCNFTR